MHKILLWKSKFSALLDWFLHRTLFYRFDTLGSHLREEGSLDYDGGFVRLQVHLNFNTNIHCQHEETKEWSRGVMSVVHYALKEWIKGGECKGRRWKRLACGMARGRWPARDWGWHWWVGPDCQQVGERGKEGVGPRLGWCWAGLGKWEELGCRKERKKVCHWAENEREKGRRV
jgi:hypothetical protein